MNETIQNLKEENQKLRNIINEVRRSKVIQEKIVIPRDYELNKRLLKNAILRLKKAEKLVNYGNISQLSVLIDEYISQSTKFLKRIAMEGQLLDFGKEENLQLQNLIDFLEDMKIEFYALLTVQIEGKFPLQSQLSECEVLMRNIVSYFQQADRDLQIQACKIEELNTILTKFFMSLKANLKEK